MDKAPGHQKWPDHKVREQHVAQTLRVECNGELVAESNDVIKVEEDNHPVRYYFPRSDVAMDKLERTDTTSTCPFKGLAHYYSLNAGHEYLTDAAWTYEDPYAEHRDLKDRIAFYDDKVEGIDITALA